MTERSPILPAHIEDTVRSIARLHQEQQHRTTPLQQLVNHITASVGRPAFVALLTGAVTIWVGGNLLAQALGRQAWDPPPFNWLSCAVSVVALYTTVLILTTQRYDDELAKHREQLTLELAILSEQKSAKIIQLLEELRADSPHLANRHDALADAMSKPTDPQSVLNAIQESADSAQDVVGPAANPPSGGAARP